MDHDDSPTPKEVATDLPEEARIGFLVRKVAVGEGLIVGPNIEISVTKVGKEQALVCVRAPKDVPIRRVIYDQFRKDPTK